MCVTFAVWILLSSCYAFWASQALGLTDMSASPCSTKCSAVVTVSSARTIPSCTVSPLLSLHFWIRDTTCTGSNIAE